MSSILIKNVKIIKENCITDNHSVLFENGKISKIYPEGQGKSISAEETLDGSGRFLAPGYIDMHIHGVKGFLVDKGAQELQQMCKVLPEYGVTSFLPTVTPTVSEEKDITLLNSLSNAVSKGTEMLGFFMEGHFLAQSGAFQTLPENMTIERVEKLKKAAFPFNTVFAISPEIEGVDKLIGAMKKNEFPVFITHTAANVEQTEKAMEAGAVHATHFYDVFPCPQEKDMGVRPSGAVEAILANPKASVDFILDGEHVDPIAVKMAIACKGREKVCLITDANLNAGMPPGSYDTMWGYGVEVAYEGGPARMDSKSKNPGGLAGSGLTMDRAVKNAVKLLGVDIPLAVAMASSNPARVLGIDGRKGFIKEGYDADIILLDGNLDIVGTWVGGRCCFDSRKQK
jgi:N-acetylglucosamine-6-phosphate deacetylase